MEEGLFQEPKTVAAFNDGFIEARLHTDINDEKIQEKILALQKRLAKTPALPTFLVIDPDTEAELARHVGMASEKEFLDFLSKGRTAGS